MKSIFTLVFAALMLTVASCNSDHQFEEVKQTKHSSGRLVNSGWAWVENLSVDMSQNSNVADINGLFGYELYTPNMALVAYVTVIPPAGAATPANSHQWQVFNSVHGNTNTFPFTNSSVMSKPWVYKVDSGKTFEIRVTWYVSPDNDSSTQSDTASNSFYVTIP